MVTVLQHRWRHKARPNQLSPAGDWGIWLILAGRGWGKNRTGAEWIHEEVEAGRVRRIGLIARTAGDVRDVMVEGEAGIMATSKPWFRPHYESSKRRITWPNGAIASTFTGDEPDQLRGPSHDLAWADELAAWRYLNEAYDNLMLGLRIGKRPRLLITTTPRPLKILKELIARDGEDVALVRGSTYENIENLAPAFRQQILQRYEGTRLGRQELHAEVLDEIAGALWTYALLEETRVIKHPALTRIVVGVDPEVTSGEDSAETGIIVAGAGVDGNGYVLDDATIRGTPDSWAKQAVSAYHRYEANLIIAEKNQGGEMVEYTLRTIEPDIPITLVSASKSKQARAEPISALYEQGKIHHVGNFAELEDQLVSWIPGEGPSPDRLDALVWAFTELLHSLAGGVGFFGAGGHKGLGRTSPWSKTPEGSRWSTGTGGSRKWGR